MPRHLLVVSDGGALAGTLRRLLPGRRYVVTSANYDRVLQETAGGLPDLVIVDGQAAPDQAAGLARHLRQSNAGAHVVAVVPSIDLAGDESGILYRDHVPTEDELVAWLSEEGRSRGARVLRVGRITLDLDSRRLDVDGQVSVLTPKQFKLLSLLMSRPGEVLTRKQLMKEVWETDYTGDTRTLDVHIHWVRERIGDVPGQPKYLQTVRRVGYRFVDPTADEGQSA